MGMKMPPARAVVEGMAGAIRVSAALSPYASPRVLLPKSLTKMVATLSPSPVFWKPCKAFLHQVDGDAFEKAVNSIMGTFSCVFDHCQKLHFPPLSLDAKIVCLIRIPQLFSWWEKSVVTPPCR